MSTLAERIDWILQNCTRPDGTRWTAKDISVSAGLSQSHVGQIKRGTIPDPGGETLAKIARVVGVSPRWLLTGEGRPLERDESARRPSRGGDHLRDLANWSALLAGARMLEPGVEEWAWEHVAGSNGLLTGPPTAASIAWLGRYVMQFQPPPPRPPPANTAPPPPANDAAGAPKPPAADAPPRARTAKKGGTRR